MQEIEGLEVAFQASLEGKVPAADVTVDPVIADAVTQVDQTVVDGAVTTENDTSGVAVDFDAVDYGWDKANANEAAPIEYDETFNKTIEEKYKGYGIKSGKDIEVLVNKVSDLEKKLAETPPVAEIQFENDYQRKLYEFAKTYDGANGRSIEQFEHLTSLDVTKMTDKDKLKEVFVHENREHGRVKAERMFELDYEEKYDTTGLDPELNPEDARRIEKKNLLLEFDAFNASKKLVEAISKFKPVQTQKPESVQNTKISESVQKTLSTIDTDLKDFGVLEVRLPVKENNVFRLGLSEDKVAVVNDLVKSHFSNPLNYNAEGKESNGHTPKALATIIAQSIFHNDIVEAAVKRAIHVYEAGKIREKQPVGQRQLANNTNSGKVEPKTANEAFDMFLEA